LFPRANAQLNTRAQGCLPLFAGVSSGHLAQLLPMTEYASHAADSQVSGSLTGNTIGRFVIGERLGKGGMGEVYRAEDTRLKRTVALKRLSVHLRSDPLYRRRFEEEAERASRLNDAHIAAIHDVIEEQGEIFLVMEFIEGQTLRQRLREPMSLEQFFGIAVQCVQALAAAHGQGIVHCDIKPENIMLTSDGQVKILDFGVARHLPRSAQSTTVDRSGAVSGTPAYMSPEVLLEKTPDGRADIFSLGVVFYEVLAGYHPFLADGFVATSDRIRCETPAPIHIFNSEVPEELEKLVNKAMAKEPGQRYANTPELLEQLRLVEGGITPTGLSRLLPAKAELRPKHTLLIMVAVALVAAGLLAVFYYNGRVKGWFGSGQAPVHLAVLPFTATVEDPSTKAFSNGLTEMLAVKLTQLSGSTPLQVVPTSAIRAEGISNVEQARKGFGVTLVLEGSLQESGNRVRITYSLVDATSMRQLSGDTITADMSDVFGLQDRVVESVVNMLGLQLRVSDRHALVAHGTQEPAAYDYYLRGLGYLQDYHKPENVSSAIALFSRALERDPNYALAYAGLGEAYGARYNATYERRWMDQAMQACERAVALDSDSAKGRTCLGTVYASRGRYQEAVEQFQRAVQTDPTSEGAYRGLASAYERLGRLAEAENTYRLAIQVRPEYWAGYGWLGSFYSHQARYGDAAREFSHAIALAPDDPHNYLLLGGVYIFMGDYAKAIEVLQHAITLSPTPYAYSNLGVAYFNLRRFDDSVTALEHACTATTKDYDSCGNLARAYYWSPSKRSQAPKMYERAIRMAGETLRVNPRDGDIHVLLADYYAMLSNRSQALKHLQEALNLNAEIPEYLAMAAIVHNQFGEKDEALGWLEKARARGYSPAEIRASPELDNLRDEPRFQQLIFAK
jgi:tetratricopeptide (TPR) repeat protein/TolB-like protein/predicted Ser/Thr protein kinase